MWNKPSVWSKTSRNMIQSYLCTPWISQHFRFSSTAGHTERLEISQKHCGWVSAFCSTDVLIVCVGSPLRCSWGSQVGTVKINKHPCIRLGLTEPSHPFQFALLRSTQSPAVPEQTEARHANKSRTCGWMAPFGVVSLQGRTAEHHLGCTFKLKK